MKTTAIIGTGVAGLGCAWNLRKDGPLVLIEKNDRAGGHTNTRVVDEDGVPVPIDTGFIVFNYQTYPHLVRLFSELGVAVKPAEMSFAVRHDPDRVEYNGMGPGKVFAWKRNLFRPRFHRMLRDTLRFFREAVAELEGPEEGGPTLFEFARDRGFSSEFLDWYLFPMGSAIWSTVQQDMAAFPARTLIRFFHNHGFLGVKTHHPWFTVDGGARRYVDKILDAVGRPLTGCAAVRVREEADGVRVTLRDGSERTFDRVILACHADEALAMIDQPTALQHRLLSPFRYQKNHAMLHSDPRFMPRRRKAWASWNFLVRDLPESGRSATVHYWMNALQGVSNRRDYFVSLNCPGEIPSDKVLYETEYTHPVFTEETTRAQKDLFLLNTHNPGQRVFFCGSYFRYGFHEDAYASAVRLCEHLPGSGRVSGPVAQSNA